MSKLHVDVFSDVVCPWCFVGSARLDAVLKELPADVEVSVEHHAYLLMPDAPAAGLNIQEYLRRKYGRDPNAMNATVEAAAREAGLQLDLSRQKFSYNTADAHTLMRHAGPRGTQHALSTALFRAHFVDARNVSDPAVLEEVAVANGFTAPDVKALLSSDDERKHTHAEAHEAARMGVRGVPFFVFNGAVGFSGAQSAPVFRQAIQQALEAPPPA